MFDSIFNFGTSVYILWGIGVLGLLLKLAANIHMKRMIKASGNMATTKRRALRIMRLKYINGKSLGINAGSSASFVDKNVRSMRYLGVPLYVWRRTGLLLSLGIVGMLSGAFLYNDISWRGSPEMVEMLASGICVCAFLMALENIFLINNKLEILKANIRDYLDNVPGSPKSTVNPRGDTVDFHDARQIIKNRNPNNSSAVSEAATTAVKYASPADEASLVNKALESLEKPERSLANIKGDNIIDVSPHIKSVAGDKSESDEAVLNSFLKEFFS